MSQERKDPKAMDISDLSAAILLRCDWFEDFEDRAAMEQMYTILYNESDDSTASVVSAAEVASNSFSGSSNPTGTSIVGIVGRASSDHGYGDDAGAEKVASTTEGLSFGGPSTAAHPAFFSSVFVSVPEEWRCSACTFDNSNNDDECAMCGFQKEVVFGGPSTAKSDAPTVGIARESERTSSSSSSSSAITSGFLDKSASASNSSPPPSKAIGTELEADPDKSNPDKIQMTSRLTDASAKSYEECFKILKRNGWNYERSFHAALATELGEPEPPHKFVRPFNPPSGFDPSGVRRPDANHPGAGSFIGNFPPQPPLLPPQLRVHNPFTERNYNDMYQNNNEGDDDDYNLGGPEINSNNEGEDFGDEDGYRRADKSKVGNFRAEGFGGASMERSVSNGYWEQSFKNDEPGVSWPVQLSRLSISNCGYDDTLQLCLDEDKFLLMNIQRHDNEVSLELNRLLQHHTARGNPRLCKIIQDRFILFQRGHTSEDAKSFMRRHGISEFELPFLSIIHPLTGANLKEWGMKLQPQLNNPAALTSLLEEFLSINSSIKPKPRTNPKVFSYSSIDSSSGSYGGNNNSARGLGGIDVNVPSSSYGGVGNSISNIDSNSSSSSSSNSNSNSSNNCDSSNIDSSSKVALHDFKEASTEAEYSYGPVPIEPDASESKTCDLKLRGVDGKTHRRKFRLSDQTAGVLAWVSSIIATPVLPKPKFDVLFGFPPSVLNEKDAQIGQILGLPNSTLSVKIINS